MNGELQPAEQGPDEMVDRPLPAYVRAVKKGGAVTVLSAAMVAVGEILEPEKATVELVRPADTSADTGLDLDFGGLPPLD